MKFRFSDQTAVAVSDRNAALDFYTKTLGLPVRDSEWGPLIEAGPMRLFVDETEAVQGQLMELVTDDLDAARAHLKAAGCREITWGGLGEANLFEDPFGVKFNLWQEPPRS